MGAGHRLRSPLPSSPLLHRAPDPVRARNLVLAIVAAVALWGLTAVGALADGSPTYIVQPGDTLSTIAARQGATVAELVALNQLANPNHLVAGQTLYLGSGRTKVVASAPARSGGVIAAPYVSQFDGSVYAESNCGPASLDMALGALGISTDPITLRHLTSRQMGFDNPANGTTWESLVYAARASGARTDGLYRSGHRYRVWSIEDLSRAFAAGHPVLLLVRYRSLPGHQTSRYWGDHYIVGLGFDAAGNLIYHDPAFRDGSGAHRTISRDQLLKAWSSTAVRLTRTAMAVAR